MQNRRTTAQINPQTLSRLKELAKARNQPLYVVLEEAVITFLEHATAKKEASRIDEIQCKKRIYRQLLDIKPFTGKNKWLTSGAGGLIWLLYTLLPD